jgi:hypothetical protein
MKRREFITLLGGTAVAWPSVAQTQDRPARILYFTHSAGYRHDVIPASRDVLQRIGALAGFEITASEEPALFTTDNLRRYGAVMFFTTGELPMSTAEQVAFSDFIRTGGGFLGVHSATDTFYQWPEYRKLIGGYFDQHPWHQTVVVKVAERDDPLVAFLGESFPVTDEIYQIRDFDVGAPACCCALIRLRLILLDPTCIGIRMGGRWLGRGPMGTGAYSIRRSATRRWCGAIPGSSSCCAMPHYGFYDDDPEPRVKRVHSARVAAT